MTAAGQNGVNGVLAQYHAEEEIKRELVPVTIQYRPLEARIVLLMVPRRLKTKDAMRMLAQQVCLRQIKIGLQIYFSKIKSPDNNIT